MPRSVTGVYTVPSGINPVVAGTTILDSWANPTLADVAQGVTDSLDRYGRGGMLAALGAVDGSAAAPAYTFSSSPTAGIFLVGANTIGISTSGAEAWRIDSSGRLIGGETASISVVGTTAAKVQLHGLSLADTALSLANWNSSASSTGALAFAKSKSNVIGTHTLAAASDNAGTIRWFSDDGVNFIECARIAAVVDDTPGVNDMPGRISFYTTPNGAAAVVEAWRIDNANRFVGGGTAAQATRVGGTGVTPQVQNHGVGSGVSLSAYGGFAWANDSTSAPHLMLSKSRGTSIGTHTIVIDNDILGRVSFVGSDGTQFTEAARIQAQVDGTPGTNDMPGILLFYTTADGSSSPTQRMGITSDGRIYGTGLHNNGTVTGTANQFIASGTYTPVGVVGTNIATITPQAAQWMRVGNVVTVSGSFTVDPTAANTNSGFRLSLPITSSLTATNQCSGVFAIISSPTTNQQMAGRITADIANDDAFFNYTTDANVSATNGSFVFTYVIL